MALADTARLAVQLDLKGNFGAQLRSNQKLLGNFDASVSKTQSRAFKAGQQIGTGIKRGAVIAAGAVGLLATQVVAGLHSLEELETVTTQTNSVLKSTKGVAGQTADSIRNLANKYEGLNATIDDKVIQSGENVLLTFTNIRKQAFEPALRSALDLSTAMGQDLQSSIVQVGKALSDPVKGITALTRVGVTFTAQQKEQIKALVKTGDTLGAQKIILAELNKEFGGSFLAGGSTTAGKVAKFKDAIEELQKALATALLPTIGKIADALSKFLADPKVIRGVEDLGKSIASLFSDANLKQGADFLKGAFETAKSAAPVVAQAAKTTFWFVQAAVGLFKQLPAPLQGLLVGGFAVNKLTGGLVTNIASGIIGEVGKNFLQRGGTPANPLFVKEVGLPGGPDLPGGKPSLLKTAAEVAAATALLVGTDVALTTLNQANAAQGQTKADAFGVTLPGGRVQRSLQDIIAEQRKSNGTLLDINGNVLAGQTGRGFITAGGFDSRIISGGAKASGGKDDLVNLAQLQRGANAYLRDGFHQMVAELRHAKDSKSIVAAVHKVVQSLVTQHHGSLASTKSVLSALKAQLKNTHDPKTAAALRSAIAKVERKVVGREYAQRQINAANKILHSSESTKQKINDLKRIEQQLKDHGLPHAAAAIQAKIDSAKRAQVYAARATTEAVKDKDLSVTVNVPAPRVSLTTIINGTRIVSSYGGNKRIS